MAPRPSSDSPEAPASSRSAAVRLLLEHQQNAVFTAIAVVLGLPSLLYPFGRDQGLYYYVGREWVLRGSVPYRDVLDHKTPGIYVLHALAVLLFGEKQWGIRVFDLAAVVAFGLVAGSLFERSGKPIKDGIRGGAALFASLLFYGFLDFWNTAQSELWYSGLGVAGVWAAWRARTIERASAAAGVFAGMTLVMKPPGIWFLFVALGLLLLRLRREQGLSARALLRHGALYAAGAALVPGLVLAYFGSKGALFAMRDIVVGANSYYVKHESGSPGHFNWKDHAGYIFTVYAPFTVIFPAGVALGLALSRKRRDVELAERNVIALLLLASAILAVSMQGKYYLLHWGTLAIPGAFLGVVAIDNMSGHLRPFLRAVILPGVAAAGYVATAWIGKPWMGQAAVHQRDTVALELRYLRGEIPREALHDRFQEPIIGFWYANSYRVGRWLKEHTSPEDTITVRGFQPEIYAIAERRHAGRFFWTTFLTNPARAYRREEWLAEDRRDLESHPPKYVVTLTDIHQGPDSSEWFLTVGYHTVLVMGQFTIVAR